MFTREKNFHSLRTRSRSLLNGAIVGAVVTIFASSCSDSAPNSSFSSAQQPSESNPSAIIAQNVSFHDDEAPALALSETQNEAAVARIESSDPSGEFQSASAGLPTSGELELSVTDAPLSDVQSVKVGVSRIQIRNRTTGEILVLRDSPITLDLLRLRDGLTAAIGAISLPEGAYDQLRLFISSVAVEIGGAAVQVAIPSEISRDGLRIFGLFVIKRGVKARALFDLDVSRFFVWGKRGPIFRPIAKLRKARFQPAGIHLEDAGDGSLKLVGPPKSVRPEAWLLLTDQWGDETKLRASPDGSFEFTGIDKVLGEIELAVLSSSASAISQISLVGSSRQSTLVRSDYYRWKWKKKKGGSSSTSDDDDDRDTSGDLIQPSASPISSASPSPEPSPSPSPTPSPANSPDPMSLKKIAWIKLKVDFVADDRYPRILGSHLEAFFRESFQNAGEDPAAFLSLFQSDAFRFLAIKFLESTGRLAPTGASLPQLPTPYAFALEGPEYDLPGYAHSSDVHGLFSGGPAGGGCSDARVVFEGRSPINDYSAVDPEPAMRRMLESGLPFTGLLAEYEGVCRLKDLSSLSCPVLGTLASSSSHSLPSQSLTELESAMNAPRGGLIAKLLSCLDGVNELPAIDPPAFPAAQPGCWYGCGGSSAYYSSDLLGVGQADSFIGDPAAVLTLDSFVEIAKASGVAPLKLLASYLADHAATPVHGFQDRKSPKISNIVPVDGAILESAEVRVSASMDDRSIADVRVNGASIPFGLAPDGSVRAEIANLALAPGLNSILIEAFDAAGNQGSALISVSAPLPSPSPSPSATPTPDPSPSPSATPTPDPSPSPSATPTPDPSPSPSATPTPDPSPSPSASPTPAPSPSPSAPAGVTDLCFQGAFVASHVIRVGLSMDTADSSYTLIKGGFESLGFIPITYSDAQIAAGQPTIDGVTVLVISRKVTLAPVTPQYVTGVRNFVQNGGSLLGEYDGAALVFSQFSGSNAIIPRLSPSLSIFNGDVTGGGAILPISSSTLYVTDPNDPIMQGMPTSFLLGPRSGFAISGFNSNWLHVSGSFTSVGYLGLMPVGDFPAVMSGRCAQGRVAMFTMNHFQVMTTYPANQMVINALNWLVGN